jgi:hypothetical protein
MQIDVATQFSPYPSGRFPTDGSFNGEKFRDEFLVPALSHVKDHTDSEKLKINIDGVRTFGSSFLEEAFAGLIRKRLFTKDELRGMMEIVCTRPHLLIFRDTILTYIDEARPEVPEKLHA